jgi:hypothetical protein
MALGASPRIPRKAYDRAYTVVDIDALVPAQSLPAAADPLANASTRPRGPAVWSGAAAEAPDQA